MSSASIFKPIHPISIDIPKMRSPFSEKRHRIGLEKVRRVLFGPINHIETQKFVDDEMEKCRLNQTGRWEFDFQNGVPVNQNGNSGRFNWKPIRYISEKITLAPKRRRSLEEEFDNSELYTPSLDTIQVPIRQNNDDQENRVEDNNNKKQMKITDFMQSRKRAADSTFIPAKKLIPNKIQRQESSHCS